MVPGVIGKDSERDLATLVVARVGRLEETGSPWEPYRLVDPAGAVVQPAAQFLAELQALGRSEATQRSYGERPAAVVPVPLGDQGAVGSGHSGRSA